MHKNVPALALNEIKGGIFDKRVQMRRSRAASVTLGAAHHAWLGNSDVGKAVNRLEPIPFCFRYFLFFCYF